MSTKTILISKKKQNKKQEIFREILASKEKVKEMINRRKEYLKTLGYLTNIIEKKEEEKPTIISSQDNTICLGKSRSLKRNENIIRKTKRNKNSNRNNNSYDYKKTHKFNSNEIKFIIKTLKRLVDASDYKKLNKHIKKTTRCQAIQILSSYNIITKYTKAPTPLIKNIMFNVVLGNIRIILE